MFTSYTTALWGRYCSTVLLVSDAGDFVGEQGCGSAIIFLRIRIEPFSSMRIRIKRKNFLKINLCRVFCNWNSHTQKPWSWTKYTIKSLTKLRLHITNVLAFFLLLFFNFFHLQYGEPDPGGKMSVDSCWSGSNSTALFARDFATILGPCQEYRRSITPI